MNIDEYFLQSDIVIPNIGIYIKMDQLVCEKSKDNPTWKNRGRA